MYQYTPEQRVTAEQNAQGIDKMTLTHLSDFAGKNPKVRMFARVSLNPGEEVPFHTHTGECEYYYILSGAGIYSDNGTAVEVKPGLITFTPSGNGHGIQNTGTEQLEFIALIVVD